MTHQLSVTTCPLSWSDRLTLWGPGQPYLYDVDVTLSTPDGTVIDAAQAYAGMRSVAVDGRAIRINGEKVFQRLVLDQGYWHDGIMTAPSDEALRRGAVSLTELRG